MPFNLLLKLKALRKSISVIENWHLYPLLYFNLLNNDATFILKNKIKIKLRTNTTDIQAFTNVWLFNEYKDLTIEQNDTIIDIGAHVGLFTLFVSQHCKKGRILCFEPIKENYDALSDNIQLNKLENVKTFQSAVADKSGITKIFLSDDFSAHSLHGNGVGRDVTSISLKEIFDVNKIENCDLLKLDCEGSEYAILNALPELYYNRTKKIIMEYHMAYKKPELLQELLVKLEEMNYEVTIHEKDKDSGILLASKRKVKNDK